MGNSVNHPLRISVAHAYLPCYTFLRAVEGHFNHPHGREWMNIADTVTPLLAQLVGECVSEKYQSQHFFRYLYLHSQVLRSKKLLVWGR